MREIDLAKYNIHTDLVHDLINKVPKCEEKIEFDGGFISRVHLNAEDAFKINRKEGEYTTIYFDDITDNDNFKKINNILNKELSIIFSKMKILKNYSCMIIGLGNEKIACDLLGPLTCSKVIVTRHIYEEEGLEEGFRITSSFTPGVMGDTGIETFDIIKNLVSFIKPDFVIAIDALASENIDKLLKTIQISSTGISPGSALNNKRKELSFDTLGIPVISIGVPTTVSGVTLVSDTLNYMMKHFSFNIKNKDNIGLKLIPNSKINYLKNNNYSLDKKEENYFLGAFGTLSNFEKKALINDVLTPIGYNLLVTPKEIDFITIKLSDLISNSLNFVLHNISTK